MSRLSYSHFFDPITIPYVGSSRYKQKLLFKKLIPPKIKF